MQPLRRFAATHRALVGVLLALALAMKLAMPAGFMPTAHDGGIVVALCSGSGPATMTVAIPGLEQRDPAGKGHPKAEQPCAFAGLSAPSLAACCPMILAVALLFVIALGLGNVAPAPATAPPRLRPPLRGPPLTA